MTEYVWSFVLRIPQDWLTQWNALSAAWGGEDGPAETWGTFSIKTSANGQEPVSHYCTRFWSTPTFKTMLEQAKQGIYPPELVHPLGIYTKSELDQHMAVLDMDIASDGSRNKFNEVLNGWGVQLIPDPVD